MPRSTPAPASGTSVAPATPTTPAAPRPRARTKAKPPQAAVVPPAATADTAADTTPATPADTPAQRLERIRVAAYGRYTARGMQGGYEVEDWLEAEREIDRQDASAGPRPA